MCQLSVCLLVYFLVARFAVYTLRLFGLNGKRKCVSAFSLPSTRCPHTLSRVSSTVAVAKAALKRDFYTRALK